MQKKDEIPMRTASRPLPGNRLYGSDRRRCLVVPAAAVTVSLWLILLLAAPAQAHAELVSSSPAAGERLTSTPTALQLTFSDPINPQLITVLLGVGDQTPSRLTATAGGPTVTAPVPTPPAETPGIPTTAPSPQTWTVTYQVVSADGHPISGKVQFTVAAAPPTTPTTPTTPPATSNTGSATATVTASPTVSVNGSGSASTLSTGPPLVAAVQPQPHNEDDIKPLIGLIIGAAVVIALGWIVLLRQRSRTPRGSNSDNGH